MNAHDHGHDDHDHRSSRSPTAAARAAPAVTASTRPARPGAGRAAEQPGSTRSRSRTSPPSPWPRTWPAART
ncbi:hypothetical protein GXW82_35935 [Streptacidiphilus sp. 4-A2]|nr:hypothetical protein [Streptacidiphilus sp. 4-A2]